MGTISHHQSRAQEFLHRADRLMPDNAPADAAVALRRAASHATTALAVHYGRRHNSTRRLEIALHAAVSNESLSRSHLKTFRQAHAMTQGLASPPAGQPNPNSKPGHPVPTVHPCQTTLRRMRRRVASLIKHANALIAGRPKPVIHHKRWQRDPNLPPAPDFTSAQDIAGLPNFHQIRERFALHGVGLAASPDPHDCYSRGQVPRPCQCHADLWNQPQSPNRITLSPLWRNALEKTFGIRLPNPLELTC